MSIRMKLWVDKTLKGRMLEKFVKSVKHKGVFVGYTENYHYDEKGASAALVATTNEFGVPEHNQPPRPFLRTTVKKKSRQWKDIMSDEFIHSQNWDKMLNEVAQACRDDISESIAKWKEPPNAPTTIKKKGFNDPLIDTGNMMDDFLEIIKE